jgi:hypothetical protein
LHIEFYINIARKRLTASVSGGGVDLDSPPKRRPHQPEAAWWGGAVPRRPLYAMFGRFAAIEVVFSFFPWQSSK